MKSFTIYYDEQPEMIISRIEKALLQLGIKLDVKDSDDGFIEYVLNTEALDNAMKLSFEAGRKLDYQDLTVFHTFEKEELAYPTFEDYVAKCNEDISKNKKEK